MHTASPIGPGGSGVATRRPNPAAGLVQSDEEFIVTEHVRPPGTMVEGLQWLDFSQGSSKPLLSMSSSRGRVASRLRTCSNPKPRWSAHPKLMQANRANHRVYWARA